MQYTVQIIGGQLGAHYPPLSFADSYSISAALPFLFFLCQQFLAIWSYFLYTKHVLSPFLSLSTSITLGSLTGPSCPPLFWYPPLYWSLVLHVIWLSLFLYDPPPNLFLCYVFPDKHAIFLSNILSSALLCLWFLSNLTTLFCYFLIVQRELFAFANFLLIPSLNPLLNFSIRGYFLYSLPLAILNSWTYSLHVFLLWSIVLNCSTFLSFSAISPNSFLILLNNSSVISTSNSSFDNLFNRLSFHTSATPPCT